MFNAYVTESWFDSFFVRKRKDAFSFFVKKNICNLVKIIMVWNENMKYRRD